MTLLSTAFVAPLPLLRTAHNLSVSHGHRHLPVAQLRLTNPITINVDPKTGRKATVSTPDPLPITAGNVTLPKGLIPSLATEQNGVTTTVETDRKAEAAVYTSSPSADPKKVIIFAHGFSQRPRNYRTTINRLAALGYTVIAPRTWLFDVAWPFVRVETIDRWESAAAKLQTAVLIDVARAVHLSEEHGAEEVHLMGHSMGGAMALAYAGKKQVDSVILLAPAVGATTETDLNCHVVLGSRMGKEKMEMLELGSARVMVLRGSDDFIVKRKDMDAMIEVLGEKVFVEYGEIVDGSHLGFEDRLDEEWRPLEWIERVVFKLVDFVAQGFGGENGKQLVTVKRILTEWLTEESKSKVGEKENVQEGAGAETVRLEIEAE